MGLRYLWLKTEGVVGKGRKGTAKRGWVMCVGGLAPKSRLESDFRAF